jgi:hypothetical protein
MIFTSKKGFYTRSLYVDGGNSGAVSASAYSTELMITCSYNKKSTEHSVSLFLDLSAAQLLVDRIQREIEKAKHRKENP